MATFGGGATPSLFGGAATPSGANAFSPDVEGPSLFGGTPAPATGLFGGAPAAAGGGLFGGAPAAAGGGLFGGAPAPAAGLFGGAPAAAGGGLFGGAQAGGGLFGGAPAAAPGAFDAPPGNLFGAAPAAAPMPSEGSRDGHIFWQRQNHLANMDVYEPIDPEHHERTSDEEERQLQEALMRSLQQQQPQEIRVGLVVTLYDDNRDGMFVFDEFIKLVSDLLCLRDGVLFVSPQAGRNLAEVLAKQIPGPARHTIEVADLVELDGRWASLIKQPDVMAAGGAGLRSLSDQRLHGDVKVLRAQRVKRVVMLYDANGDGDEFIELVSDLLCLREGVLFAPPQVGHNLAEILAKQIPGPARGARDTIEVKHLVELDGRWASLIKQPDVMAAGGAGLRSLSDQRLHGDVEDLRARRQAASRAVPVAEAAVAPKRGGSWGSSAGSSWFYDDPLIRGTAVRQGVIDGSDQYWRFVDHHDGTGLAYFSPKKGAPRVPEHMELQGTRFALRQLGKAGSFPPSRGEMPRTIPTRSGSVISTSTIRKSVPRPSGSWAAVDACLASLGLQAVDVGGGGDCFFRSLAAQVPHLGLSPDSHAIARCLTVQYMREYPELFRDFVPLRDGQSYERCGPRLVVAAFDSAASQSHPMLTARCLGLAVILIRWHTPEPGSKARRRCSPPRAR
jgi:hypothetical protein